MQKKIEEIRKKIDKIDENLVKLLNERGELVKEIFEIKKEEKKPFFDPSREKRIIERLIRKNVGILKPEDIKVIMETIFKVYRGMFKEITVAYLGPEGTFTHQAALEKFGEKAKYIPVKTIDEVFREVEKQRADYGVVPIENSIEGVVTHTLDVFLESELKITSEILLEIHHYLLSKEKSIKNIKKLYSHPQAIAQCRNWISENLKDVEIFETESTGSAVKKALKEKNSAAIASEIASSIYNLNILAERIEDFRENYTRFLVIGKNFSERTGNDKTSILFSIKDKVGALHDILVPFKREKINLTRIESRPSKKKAWEYVFFVDFIGHKDDENVKRALKEVEKSTVFLKVLGSYPKER
ncbi:MAG: prephenate dehydratase [Candidatus Omnitrophica bacterium]|nr:prephenate dehydratase [Candidatus Omnitrophota bacterium]MCM8806484.1 prephenate dehydratase [Candidatus Omnitrophota bacterium]